jgi:O-antigen ligase
VAAFGIASSSAIRFTTESNYQTSGGYGPNQVSSILGLGALVALLCTLIGPRRQGKLGLVLFAMVVDLAAQSALTFSRSGLYCACGGASAAAIVLCRDARTRLKFALMAAVLGFITYYVLIPSLDLFTRGSLVKRFTEKGYSGRDSLLEADLNVFAANPFLGVGPGSSPSTAWRA